MWLGTVIGVLPVYGLHLLLCIGLAKLLRLSALKAYLAAHVNNPLTAPFLFYLSLGTGSLLTTGNWPSIRIEALKAAGVLKLSGDLLLGSLAVGLTLGGALAGLAYGVRQRWQSSSAELRLADRTAKRYLEGGIFDWEFVGGKLRHDPLYFGLLTSGVLAGRKRLLDLGCGRGILLALLTEAEQLAGAGAWPESWGRPLGQLELTGVEKNPRTAAVARAALGEAATVITADLSEFELRRADAILLLDVLHYLPADEQERLLKVAAARIDAGGILVLREVAADGGVRFLLTRGAERVCAIARLHWRQRFCYRSAAEWAAILAGYGLQPKSTPMSRGTPYSNVLILARKPVGRGIAAELTR